MRCRMQYFQTFYVLKKRIFDESLGTYMEKLKHFQGKIKTIHKT